MMSSFKGDLQKAALQLCAELAYRDLCRTIRNFKKESIEEARKNFREGIYDLIIERIKTDIFTLSDPINQFDSLHKDICCAIIEKANKSGLLGENGLYFGQAQKWLNMTLKNILLFNLCPAEMTEALIESLHAPVDKIIIKHARNGFNGVMFPSCKDKAWSRWSWDNYSTFQKTLRESLTTSSDCHSWPPIRWEFYVWNEEKENGSSK